MLEAVLDYVPGPIAAFHQEPVVPEVVADVQSGSDVAAMTAAVTELDPLGYYLLGDGSIAGELPTEMGQVSGARIAPVIANWGTDGVVRSDWTDNIVALPDLRAAHVQELTALVSRNDFAGIDLDYRDLNPALRDEFTAFVADLADSLHATGKTLGVRVPEPVQVADDRWDTGAYDWRALGRYVDRLVVPALPELNAYADNGKLATMLQWAAGEVERYRVFVSMPALSREQVQQWVLYRPYEALLQSFGNIEVEQGGEIAPSEKLQVRLSRPERVERCPVRRGHPHALVQLQGWRWYPAHRATGGPAQPRLQAGAHRQPARAWRRHHRHRPAPWHLGRPRRLPRSGNQRAGQPRRPRPLADQLRRQG